MSLSALAQILRDRTGLEVDLVRLETLQPQLEQLACSPLDSNGNGWTAFLNGLRRHPVESPPVQRVLDLITVSETFFFRDSAQFEALRARILPQLIEENRVKRQLRILSLGCSTGEEAYSLAILIKQLLGHAVGPYDGKGQLQDWKVHIVGAYICLRNLELARAGLYRRWSFRGVNDEVIQKYFTPRDDGWELHPSVRKLVQFVPVNVVRGIGPYVDSLDLILWRNMSIYFAPPVRHRVALGCQKALRPGGYFVVGASEIGQLGPVGLSFEEAEMETVQVGAAWLYRRVQPPRPHAPAEGKRPESTLGVPPVRPQARVSAAPSALGQAQSLADRGRYDQARAACERLLQNEGSRLDALYLLAQIEQAQGHEEACESLLLQAIQLDRDFIMGHFLVGLGYCRQGHERRASRHLLRALRLLDRQAAVAEVPHSEGRSPEALRSTIQQALAQIGVSCE